MKSSIAICTITGEDSDYHFQKFNDMLTLFLEQYVITAVYALTCILSSVIFSDRMDLNAGMTLLFYMCLLITLAVISARKKGIVSSYTAKGNAALLLIHLLIFSITFLLYGGEIEDSDMVTMALTGLTLYVGFSASLSDILQVDSPYKFIKCFFSYFEGSQLKIEDLVVALSLDLVVLTLVLLSSESAYIPVVVLLLTLLIAAAIIMNQSRQKRRAHLVEYIREKTHNNRVLIYRLGTENVLLPKITVDMNTISLPNLETYNDLCVVDYVIVLNSLVRRESYLLHLNKLLSLLNPEAKIIDPSISSKGKKKMFWFTWFSVPSENLKELSVNQYARVIDDWR